MITPRTLAMFHFGFAIVFLVFGALIVYIVHFTQPEITPPAPSQHSAQSIRQSIAQNQNLEKLRSSALICYDQWRVLAEMSSVMTRRSIEVMVYSFGVTVLLLTIGGVMALRLKP